MEHYVTLFDSLFLPQGLALYASLERHAGAYTLWILCVDEACHDVLSRLALPNIRLIPLSKVETEELTRVKKDRTIGEYCWTLTPFAPRFVFEADATIERVTYIDADLWLRKSPSPIFREFENSGKHVLITDHAYSPEYDQSEISGQYCVQFMIFTRLGGEPVRKWWEMRCIEWCFSRPENGKFGDQKYLDDWPVRYSDQVHVLTQLDMILAPWNASRFPYGRAIAYHFHGLRLVGNNSVLLNDHYYIPKATIEFVYGTYLKDFELAITLLRSIGHLCRPQAKREWRFNRFKRLLKKTKEALTELKENRIIKIPFRQ